jgi:hypothetical protein
MEKLPDQLCDPHCLLITTYAFSISGVYQPERVVDCLSLLMFSTEVKMSGFVTPLPIYTFMV